MNRTPGPGNPVVLVVAAFVLVAALISFANRRQRPILWMAFSIVVVMTLYPPWLGEKVVWVQASPDPSQTQATYRHYPVSMGYAPLWSPPKRGSSNTFKPMAIHWARLLPQIGVVALMTTGLVLLRRRTRAKPEPAGETPPDSA